MPRKSTQHPAYARAAKKPTFDEILAAEADFKRAGIDFLKIDVDTALTFARIALQSDTPEKRRRNRLNAQKGYDTVLRLLQKIPLTQSDAEFMVRKLEKLRSELHALGEPV